MLKQKLASFCNFFLPAKKGTHSIAKSSGIPTEKKPDKKASRIIFRQNTVADKMTAAEDCWWIN